ncbi:MAG: hypothetical protein QNK24_08155 [Desulfuromusa sp.]|nr:hypothetical protein [Desulfuromusa sp.]
MAKTHMIYIHLITVATEHLNIPVKLANLAAHHHRVLSRHSERRRLAGGEPHP